MNNRTHVLIALALLIVLGILGYLMGRQIPPRIELPFETTSTGLAAQFASTPVDINAVLGSDRRYARPLANAQYLDFAFIPCYVALYILIALALRNYDVPGARWLSWIAIVCAVLAGLFDIAENIAILKTTSSPAAVTSAVRSFSMPKWALVFLVMLIESIVFLFWPRLNLWWRLAAAAVGALFAFVGASGLLFSALVSISDIVWSVEWIRWAMGALTLFLAGRALVSLPQLRYWR